MNREITPEETREFALNVGWQHVTEARFKGVLHDTDLWVKLDGSIPKCGLPDFPSDLAACFEGLEWFCRKHGLYTGLLTWGSAYDCYITKPGFGIFENKPFRHVASGDTKQAAIVAAVNAAARARSNDKL